MDDAPGPGSLGSRLWRELRRRRVLRTTLLYLGGAVAVVEGVDAFAEPLGVPASAIRPLAIGLASLLPLVVAFAWVFDVEATREGDGGAGGGALRRTLVLGAVATLSLGLGYLLWNRPIEPDPDGVALADPNPGTRVAVLPFETPGASEEMRVLAEHLHGRLIDGLSEALAPTDLPDSERIRVVSRLGVLGLASEQLTVDSIARLLDVETLVEGTLEVRTDSVRIRLRLVDAGTAELVDSRIAAAPSGDPVALADDLEETALAMLQVGLGEVVRDRARRLATRSPDAFRHLVLAEAQLGAYTEAMVRRDLEGARDNLELADSLYVEASRRDPAWEEPWVGRGALADARAQFAAATGREVDLPAIYARGLAFADTALTRSPGAWTALHLASVLRMRLAQSAPTADSTAALLARAEDDLRAAIRGNPTPARPLRTLSELFEQTGRLDEALAFGARAYDEDRYLRGVDVTLLRLFDYSLQLDRDADAAAYCAEGRRRFSRPYFEDCHLVLMAWSSEVSPRSDSAWAAVRRELADYAPALRPRLEPRLNALVAATLAQTGRPDSARAVLRRALATEETTSGLRLAAAGTLALLGEVEAALAQVDRLLTDGMEPAELSRAPELRALRDLPEFRARMGAVR